MAGRETLGKGTEISRAAGMGKDRTYQWVRILATFLVVMGHANYLRIATTWGGVAYRLPENVSGAYTSLLGQVLRWIAVFVYSFHMPLFFCLSGAVLHLKPLGSLKSLLKKKLWRLMVPYYLCGFLYMFPIKYLGGFYERKALPGAILNFLFWDSEGGHLWFLHGLFWCMVVFGILHKLLERFSWSERRILLLLLVGSFLVKWVPKPGFLSFLGFARGMDYFFYFVVGYCFEELRRRQRPLGRLVLLWAVAVVTEGVVYGIWGRMSGLGVVFLSLLGSYLVYLTASLLARSRVLWRLENGRGFRVLSRNLFSVYLFHDPLNYLILKFFFHEGWLTFPAGCYLYFFLRNLGVVMLSVLIGEGIKKVQGSLQKDRTGV